ncbi:MAG: hypothetical protein QM677_01045 [Microbacterium sp.]
MTDSTEKTSISRRSIVKGAAWAAPVIAVAVTAPLAAATVVAVATSVGITTSSPYTGNNGRIEVFGIDADGDDATFPDGQTFTITSSELDFDSIVTSITGGTITSLGDGVWLITPDSDATSVVIKFNSSVTGSYTVTSLGPIAEGTSSTGNVLAA